LQDELNVYVKKINSLVDELNQSASSINSQAVEYNKIGGQLGDQFEEGLYHSDKYGKYIEIYQFEDKNKLERVVMHELGHALVLDHSGDPNDIMYGLNTGINLEPTVDDINALKTRCEIK
ncbi:MAG: matrixin family metalloprotease, partial [bacterium]